MGFIYYGDFGQTAKIYDDNNRILAEAKKSFNGQNWEIDPPCPFEEKIREKLNRKEIYF